MWNFRCCLVCSSYVSDQRMTSDGTMTSYQVPGDASVPEEVVDILKREGCSLWICPKCAPGWATTFMGLNEKIQEEIPSAFVAKKKGQ